MSSGDATLREEVLRGLVHPLDRFAPQARPAGAGLDPGSLGEVAEPAGVVLLEPIDCLGRRFQGGHAVLFGEPRALAQRPLAHVGNQPLTHREVDVDVYAARAQGLARSRARLSRAPSANTTSVVCQISLKLVRGVSRSRWCATRNGLKRTIRAGSRRDCPGASDMSTLRCAL